MTDDSWTKLFADIRNSGLSVEEARRRWETQPGLAGVYELLGKFFWELPVIDLHPIVTVSSIKLKNGSSISYGGSYPLEPIADDIPRV